MVQRQATRTRRDSNTDRVAERIGPRVRARRLELGMSMRELARRLGVSPSFVSRLETGRCPPSVGTLRTLSSELGISAGDLLSDSKPDESRTRRGTHHSLRGADWIERGAPAKPRIPLAAR